MCGIAGFVGHPRESSRAEDDLRRMCGAISHRGPDDEGRYVDTKGVALGMRRLSIIDVGGGNQPIFNEDGSVVVVYNGEVYNHHALRARLVTSGHRFKTHCDTETLVHLYEEHGDRMVPFLRGMFAFAIWDHRRNRLFCARDRVGIKPLYYWPTDDGVAFASELRSFLALERFPRTISRSAVARYLAFGYIPDPDAIFSGVRKLPPGYTLSWDREKGVQVERYWTPIRPEIAGISEQEAILEVRRLLDESVRCHLESEVPLGAFLSGGIDSSSVVAHMARAMDRKVRTFSIGFDERDYNEAPHAARVAAEIGTAHTELIVRPDADALVEEVIRAFDEPFADSSALPTYLVSQLARQHVTVALSGDGGDELFGGYTRYQAMQGRQEFRSAVGRRLLRSVARRLPHVSPGRNRLIDLSWNRRGRYATTVAYPLAASDGGVARDDIAAQLGAFDQLLDPWFDEASDRDFEAQIAFVDMLTYLPGDILTKVDRMSMAVSLEARVPLLDHEVIEFAASLPSELKMRGGDGKWILRRAIEGIVPRVVLDHPKRGFAVPLRHWFRNALRHRVEALERNNALIYEFADPRAVSRLIREHLSGRRDHSYRLWRLLALEIWLEALRRGEIGRPSVGSPSLHTLVERATVA
jgi:asparagine synthase (glutamine-hydrolysing)